uniref:Uncharacterized protein n=1 Tax=Rhizophora mucronata TaxID=61149 RepID=A0A2P2QEK4_RHIMU
MSIHMYEDIYDYLYYSVKIRLSGEFKREKKNQFKTG